MNGRHYEGFHIPSINYFFHDLIMIVTVFKSLMRCFPALPLPLEAKSYHIKFSFSSVLVLLEKCKIFHKQFSLRRLFHIMGGSMRRCLQNLELLTALKPPTDKSHNNFWWICTNFSLNSNLIKPWPSSQQRVMRTSSSYSCVQSNCLSFQPTLIMHTN